MTRLAGIVVVAFALLTAASLLFGRSGEVSQVEFVSLGEVERELPNVPLGTTLDAVTERFGGPGRLAYEEPMGTEDAVEPMDAECRYYMIGMPPRFRRAQLCYRDGKLVSKRIYGDRLP